MAKRSCSSGLDGFLRRKQVDSAHQTTHGNQLARKLTAIDLTVIGVGTTIGAGIYILVGTVARELTGPALTLSFLIAGLAAALSAFCYAELASLCPSAGSAYHYTYICVGEGVSWLIGWSLVLEYTIGGSAIARGISPNLASFFGGEERLPALLARHSIPGLGIVVDPCAAVLVVIITVLLCAGIKESSIVQATVTVVNVCALCFIIVAGGYLAFSTGWEGYKLSSGYVPFGVNGILAGAGVVFFSFIGFDAITGAAEEAKHPQRDLPLGIGTSLSLCCCLYILVSVVIVGLVPYYKLDPDTPISSAFASNGMQWAAYVITTGAVTALCASLMGSLLPQPRVLMAMARDGLLPSFFSDISDRTQVPVKSTLIAGALATASAFLMEVSQLSGMVSVGTLLAYTSVAISVLILRYCPPAYLPQLPSAQESADPVQLLSESSFQEFEKNTLHSTANDDCEENIHLQDSQEASVQCPLIEKQINGDAQDRQRRRKIAAWNITLFLVGVVVFASAASAENFPSLFRISMCGVGAAILFCSLIVLACMKQDDARARSGHAGGFLCPFVPLLPCGCILINIYLIISLGVGTLIRVLIWLSIGALVYLFYGQSHSLLVNAVSVPVPPENDVRLASSSQQV